jgi:general secretion pathway protein D
MLGTATAGPLAQAYANAIRIVPDEVNNVILVQSTKQEWDVVYKTLQQLDVPPRQVLIDAKIYEVTLVGAFSAGVSAFMQTRNASNGSTRKLTGGFSAAGTVGFTLGALVGNTRELLATLQLMQSDGRNRILSAPSVIATDNIPASITVGTSVPTLASQAIAGGAQQDGSSLFTNTITNVQTGVTLSITPRINASGIVTLQISQEVSSPLPASGAIASPDIQRRSVSTQITMADGDTVAIGGIMSETNLFGRSRVPVLGKIPFIGGLFGSTSSSKEKTELIILITPRVIYDENELVSVSNELKNRMRTVRRIMRE